LFCAFVPEQVDGVALQNVGDRAASQFTAEIGQSALDFTDTPSLALLRHPDHQHFDLLGRLRPTGKRRIRPSYFVRNEFPVPAQQGLRRDNGRHFRQHPSAQQPSFGCQAAALVVCEADPPAAQLGTKDSVFLAQILDRVLLLLIHPSSNSNQQKAERILPLRHRLSSLPLSSRRLTPSAAVSPPAFMQFQFPDITGSHPSPIRVLGD
jgi:hypothetical protein